MLTLWLNHLAGTNPIHNKKPKKKAAADEDETDIAYKQKQLAGEDHSPRNSAASWAPALRRFGKEKAC